LVLSFRNRLNRRYRTAESGTGSPAADPFAVQFGLDAVVGGMTIATLCSYGIVAQTT
jgi:hypothetical protein